MRPPENPGPTTAGSLPGPGATPPAPLPVASPPYRPGLAAQVPKPTPDAPTLLKALRRRWPVALVAGLLCGLTAAAAAWFLVPPPPFTARSMLYVAEIPPRIVFKTISGTPARPSEFETYKSTQGDLIKSNLVLAAALRNEQVAQLPIVREQVDPVGWLGSQIQVASTRGSNILKISMPGTEPEALKQIVNAVTKAYETEILAAEKAEHRKYFEKLQQIYLGYSERLKVKRENLIRLRETVGSTNNETIEYKKRLALEREAGVRRELALAQSQLRRLRNELDLLETEERAAAAAPPTPSGPVSAAELEAMLASNATYQDLQAQAHDLTGREEDARRRARTVADPAVQKYRRALNSIQQRMDAVRAQARLQAARSVGVSQSGGRRARIALLRREVELQSREVEQLTAEQEHEVQGTQTLTRDSFNLQSLQDEIALQEEAAHKVGAEVEALEVELQAPPRVRVLEMASSPLLSDDLRQAKLAVVAGFAALALAVLTITWLEFRAQRIDAVDEVVQQLGIRLVGSIPAIPPASRRALEGRDTARQAAWRGTLIESINATRAMLLHMAKADSLRAVMVTSAVGGEGKTSLAVHLAGSLAHAGYRTLLLDCDLRNPSVHRVLDVPPGPGVCDILRHEATLDEVIRGSSVAGLEVIPAGRCDTQAVQALGREAVGALLQELRGRYDFVIVDSAPILPVADSLLIGQQVDAVVLSVLRDVSRMPRVFAAYERLAMLGVRVLGAVFAGDRPDSYGASYQYAGQIGS